MKKNSRALGKNSSFLASKLNERVVTNYTRYHKRVKKNKVDLRLTITLPFGADLLTLEYAFFSIYVVTVGPEVLVDV